MVSSETNAGGLHEVPRAIGKCTTQADKNPPFYTHTYTLSLTQTHTHSYSEAQWPLDEDLAWALTSFHTQMPWSGIMFKTFTCHTSIKGGVNKQ